MQQGSIIEAILVWRSWATMLVLLLSLGLVACNGQPGGESGGLPVPEGIPRIQDPALLARGELVYREHCARCHGADAEGAPDWRKRGPDGMFPPPPLDGSGHAWHHSIPVLKGMIRNGSPQGQGNMPAWDGILSDQDMDAVIAWFQSRWPGRVYDAWYEMQQRGNL